MYKTKNIKLRFQKFYGSSMYKLDIYWIKKEFQHS